MSEEHLILSEFPLVVNPVDLRLAGKPFIRDYRREPERGLHFHVVEKDTGRIVRGVTADAGSAFHHANASSPLCAAGIRAAKPFAARLGSAPGAPPPSFGGWAGANVDRPGADFANFDLNGAFRAIAATHARKDGRCQAWTFVKPGVQGPKARCWLKSSVPPPQPNTCCVSDVMERGDLGVH